MVVSMARWAEGANWRLRQSQRPMWPGLRLQRSPRQSLQVWQKRKQKRKERRLGAWSRGEAGGRA